MTTHAQSDSRKIDLVAHIWRLIGQPDTYGLAFLCEIGGGYDHFENIIGMPVFRGHLNGSDVPLIVIGHPSAHASTVEIVSMMFDKHARGILK